jgi:hypothetical protein
VENLKNVEKIILADSLELPKRTCRGAETSAKTASVHTKLAVPSSCHHADRIRTLSY